MSLLAKPLTGTLLVHYNSQAFALPELERQLRIVLADGLPSAPVVRPVAESSVSSAVWRFLGLTGVMGVVLVRQFVFKLPVAQTAFSPFGLLVMLANLPLLRRSFEQFRADQPVSLESFLGGTTLVAVAAGEATTALEVLWIHSGAAWLTAWITERSRREITQIVQLSDREACKLVEGAEVSVPVEALSIGDLVVIHADEKIPVDGRIENSQALVDESPITGRAELVLRQPGDQVFARTLVQQGFLQVRAEQIGNATYLARIFQLVEDSLENKAPIEGVADQLARTLVNLGFVATAGTLLVTGSLWNAFTVVSQCMAHDARQRHDKQSERGVGECNGATNMIWSVLAADLLVNELRFRRPSLAKKSLS